MTRSTPLAAGVVYEAFGFTYDSAGRLASITDGDGAVTSFLRNGAGELTAIAGPDGQQTTVTLDANGYVAELTNPAGETQGFTYSDKGLITMGVDARDNASVYSYAESGRVMSNQNGAGGGHGFGVMCHASCVTGYESSRLTFDY